MIAPLYSEDEYLQALLALFPGGRVWSRMPSTVRAGVMRGIAKNYVSNNIRANNLLIDALPSSTSELLPEWEETLGLPDPCAGVAPSIEARRAQVVARFANSGGQSIPFLITFAKNLGYDIQIKQFVPARAGSLSAGQPLNGEAWAYALRIVSPSNTVTYARAGSFSAGEALAYWGNNVLECEINNVVPAHTVPIFSYS